MSAPRFIDIDGKRYLWRDLVKLHPEQRQAARQAEKPALFEGEWNDGCSRDVNSEPKIAAGGCYGRLRFRRDDCG